MARNQNTFEKRRRELERTRKAEDKREKRRMRKLQRSDESVPSGEPLQQNSPDDKESENSAEL